MIKGYSSKTEVGYLDIGFLGSNPGRASEPQKHKI